MAEAGSTLKQLRKTERETRRNLIIDAAMNLFARRPFSEVGIRDIASEAGLSPASIYRYFSDRDELFLEALFREAETMVKTLEDLLENETDLSIERVSIAYLDYLLDHDSFFQMMTHFMIHGGIGDEALAQFNEAERKFLELFDRMFSRLGMTENVRITSHAFFSALNGILISFRNYPGRDRDDVRKHIQRLAGVISESFTRLSS